MFKINLITNFFSSPLQPFSIPSTAIAISCPMFFKHFLFDAPLTFFPNWNLFLDPYMSYQLMDLVNWCFDSSWEWILFGSVPVLTGRSEIKAKK